MKRIATIWIGNSATKPITKHIGSGVTIITTKPQTGRIRKGKRPAFPPIGQIILKIFAHDHLDK